MNTSIKTAIQSGLLVAGLLASGLAAAHQSHGPYGRWSQYDRHADGWSDERIERVEYDYARVVDVDPIVRRVVVSSPRRECWTETREVVAQPRSATPTILGAIVGGVIGHQFGQGGSRHAATAAGAILGASVGHDVSAREAGIETRDVERCEVSHTRDWETRVDGYRVTYVYQGREYTTVMDRDPGRRVRVRVGVDIDVVN